MWSSYDVIAPLSKWTVDYKFLFPPDLPFEYKTRVTHCRLKARVETDFTLFVQG